MIIANRLVDGRVVFLAPGGIWVTGIADGLLIAADEDAQALLASARRDEERCHVVDPNLIDVELAAGRRRPSAIREAIRAFGPTPQVRTDPAVGRES